MADTEAEKVFKHCHKSVIWKTSLVECGGMANEKRMRPIFYAHDYKTSTILNQNLKGLYHRFAHAKNMRREDW